MFEYEPVYNLLDKYEYVVVALARPADITVPVALTREGVADVRARTARFVAVVRLVPRDVTLRVVAPVERVEDTPREDTTRLADVPRLTVVRVAGRVVAPGVRAVVERETVARFVEFAVERGLVRPAFCTATLVFTTGSANTERIEINVEQTKNAAANKNTVPIAFFTEFAFTRNVMNFSCRLLYATTPGFLGLSHKIFLHM